MSALNKWYAEHKDQAEFVVVYIAEAHPSDAGQTRGNRRQSISYATPKTFEERKTIAKACEVGLSLKIPIIIDKMDDAVEKAYSAWPDRFYIIGKDGKIAYVGGRGPRGFITSQAREELLKLIAN